PIYADVIAVAPVERGVGQADSLPAAAERQAVSLPHPRIQVQLDLGWLRGAELRPLWEAVAAGVGMPLGQVLVGCNHSHSAANVMLDRVGQPGGQLIPA